MINNIPCLKHNVSGKQFVVISFLDSRVHAYTLTLTCEERGTVFRNWFFFMQVFSSTHVQCSSIPKLPIQSNVITNVTHLHTKYKWYWVSFSAFPFHFITKIGRRQNSCSDKLHTSWHSVTPFRACHYSLNFLFLFWAIDCALCTHVRLFAESSVNHFQ